MYVYMIYMYMNIDFFVCMYVCMYDYLFLGIGGTKSDIEDDNKSHLR